MDVSAYSLQRETTLDVSANCEQRETTSENQKDVPVNEKLLPFICGLCYSSFRQIVVFYNHFKLHSDKVREDSFHICDVKELDESDRDGCEENVDIQTFNCSSCAVSFPTVCTLHEHIQEHVPKGSYTLDIQNKTGYPSSKQYPWVNLTKTITSLPKSKCNSNSKYTRSNGRKSGKRKELQKQIVDKTVTETPETYKSEDVNKLKEVCGEGLDETPENADKLDDDKTAGVDIGYPLEEEDGDMEIDDYEGNLQSDSEENKLNITDDNVKNDEETERVVDEAHEESVKVKANKDVTDTGMEDNDVKREYNFRRKRKADLEKKSSIRQSTIKVKYFGKKKFIFCEVCGVKKQQYLLVGHVEKWHSGVNLSKEFMKHLNDLKKSLANRQQGKLNADMGPNDEDYTPEKMSPTRHAQFQVHGKKKVFAECNICRMLVPNFRIAKHERFHETKAGQAMFCPERMTKCENCRRTLLKNHIEKHKCFELRLVCEKKKAKEKEVVKKEDDNQEKAKSKPKKGKSSEILPCHVCGILVKRHSIKKHLYGHSDGKPFNCSECPKCYKTHDVLRKHMQDAHGERRYQCDQCPKAFTNASILKGHYMMHTDERPFTCPECDKRFRRKSQMNNHRISHDGTPRFLCSECDKKFMRHTNLMEHVKAVHRRIRNWLCSWPQCGKPFISSTTLRRHMLIHTGEKPVKCDHCDAAFTQRTELKSHLLRRHNIDKLPPPSYSNPYSGIPHHVIKKTPASGDESREPPNDPPQKTVMFTSVMSKIDGQVLPKLTSPAKPQNQQLVYIDNTLTSMGTSYTVQQPVYSNVTPQQGTSSANDRHQEYVTPQLGFSEANGGHQDYVTPQLGTSNANGGHQDYVTPQMGISVANGGHQDYVTPGLGTSNANGGHEDCGDTVVMQETVILPIQEGYDGVKIELVPSSMKVECSYQASDSVLTTMAAVIPHVSDELNQEGI